MTKVLRKSADRRLALVEQVTYDGLPAMFVTRRVNHQREYRADDGTTNNLAESYFSRFRRMQYGQNHKFGNLYLGNYATTKCAQTRPHRDWCGYWQGNKRNAERTALGVLTCLICTFAVYLQYFLMKWNNDGQTYS